MNGQALRKKRDGGKYPAIRTKQRLLPHWISFLSIGVLALLLVIAPVAGASAFTISATDTPDPVPAGDILTYGITYDTNDANVTVGYLEVAYDQDLSFVSASFTQYEDNPEEFWLRFHDCGTAGSIDVTMEVTAYAQSQQVLTSTITAYPLDSLIALGSTTLDTTVFNPPLEADFTSNVTGGWVPFTVGFTDASAGQLIGWDWDFGDGASENTESPNIVHIYDVPGIYDVTLTAYNWQENSDTEVKTAYITATKPITADFEADVIAGTVPLTVAFTDNSTGTPEIWNWDFGDGGTSTDRNPSHTYENPGTYTVSLTAGNDFGSNVTYKPSYITVEEPAIDPVHNRNTGLNYTTIQAALDDAQTLDNHIIDVDPGTYTENIHVMKQVTLRSVSGDPADTIILATDYSDDVIEITASGVMVEGFTLTGASYYTESTSQPAGVFLNGSYGCTLSTLSAHGNVHGIKMEHGGGNTIEDTIADGNTLNGITIINSSENTLVGTSAAGNGAGFFLYNASYTGIIGCSATANSMVGFSIQAGSDGVTLEDCSVEGYEDTGIYLRQVSGCVVEGCAITQQQFGISLDESSETLVTRNQIAGNIIGVKIWPETSSNRIFFNTIVDNEFNAQSETAANAWESDGSLDYEWNGSVYSGVLGNYWSYYQGIDQDEDGVGDIPVRVYAPDESQKGSDSAPLMETWQNYFITVQALEPPVAGFTADVTSGAAPLTVPFTDTSTGDPDNWLWDFGDGTTETAEAPSHQYIESGWYSPALTVSNSEGSDAIVKEDSIRVYTAYYTIGFEQDGVSITGTGPGQNFYYETTSESLYVIENNSVTIHAIDGGILEITYHLRPLSEGEGVIFGPIASIDVRILALRTVVQGLGMIFPSINLSLSSIPDNAGLDVGIIGGAGANLQAGFNHAAGAEGLSAGSVAYCMDILPVNLTGVTNASVRMQAPESFVDAYGAGNIRICRDHNGTFSVLDTKIVGAYPSAVYFEGLSPDGFSTFGLVGMNVLFEDTDPHDGRDDDTPGPSDDDEIPEEIVEPEDEDEVVEENTEGNDENPPVLSPPVEPVLPDPPDLGDESLLDSLLSSLNVDTSAIMGLSSMVQDGGARASGIDGGDGGKQVPAGSVLPIPFLPIAAVTTSLALSGAVVAAGFVAQRAGTSVATSFLGRLFGELRRIADFVTTFIGEHFLEFIGEKEAGIIGIFSLGGAGATGRLFSATEVAVIGIGAILYGVAFFVADRASYVPVLIVSYIVVTGVAVSAHEIAHHMISRRYQVDSRVRIYYTGMVVSFLTAWLFGNVFAQPLMTHITDTQNLGKREQGIIMLAGPAVSVVLALLFLLLVPLGGLWVLAGTVGFSANLLEAVYSLVPCNPMDGKHVCNWNRYVWLLLFVPAITIYLLLYVL